MIRVVQVGFHADPHRRPGEALLQAWPALTRSVEAVARAGVELSVVQTAHRDDAIDRGGLEYSFISDGTRARERVIDRVVSLVPDVVHVHGFHNGRAVRRLTRALGRTPVLVQDHGAAPPNGWRRPAWRWAFGAIAGAAFTAPEQAAPWIESGVLRAALPIFAVLGGSSSFCPGNRDEARRATGVFGNPSLLWTGRFDANKDPLMMLAAVERAARALPGLRLWCLFGKAPLFDAVQQRIASSRELRDRVVLVGSRRHADMELYFRSADFYLQTSHREASGFSLLEALSCGTPPVVTDIPAARRIVGRAGSLTPVGDWAAFGDAIVRWARRDQPALRTNARQWFERSLTFGAIGDELYATYTALADR